MSRSDPGPDPLLGRVIDGRYRVEELLGTGQMARGYVAEQLSMRRKVALKLPAATRSSRAESKDEPEPFVKVLDFGLAKLVHPDLDAAAPMVTAPKMTVGTPAYLAPEMARSGARRDGRVDLYALAVIVF